MWSSVKAFFLVWLGPENWAHASPSCSNFLRKTWNTLNYIFGTWDISFMDPKVWQKELLTDICTGTVCVKGESRSLLKSSRWKSRGDFSGGLQDDGPGTCRRINQTGYRWADAEKRTWMGAASHTHKISYKCMLQPSPTITGDVRQYVKRVFVGNSKTKIDIYQRTPGHLRKYNVGSIKRGTKINKHSFKNRNLIWNKILCDFF